MRQDPLCGETRLKKLIPLVNSLNDELADPLDFGCPVLIVDTDDEYSPALEILVSQIDSIYSRPLIHDLDRVPQSED